MRQLGYPAGERVTVVGLGGIGLCTVAVAQATLPGRSESVARVPWKSPPPAV